MKNEIFFSMLFIKKFFLIATMACLTIQVLAQDDKLLDELSQMSMEELMDVTVVTASKYQQNILETPTSIKVITADEIKAYGWTSLAAMLQAQTGFFAFSDRVYDFIVPRGYYQSNDPNSRILLMVDGHSLVEFFGYYNGHLGSVDLDHIERVEIIKGPNSAIYGTNAMFAVINLITRTSDSLTSVKVNSETGNYRHKKIGLNSRFRVGKKWMSQVSGSFLYTGYQAIYFEEYDLPGIVSDGYSHPAANLKKQGMLQWQVSGAKTRFNLFGSFRDKQIPTGIYGGKFGEKGTYFKDINYFAELCHSEKFGNKTLKARLFSDSYHFNGRFQYYMDTNWVSGPAYESEYNTIQNLSYGAELNLDFPWNENNHSMIGLESKQYASLRFDYYSENDPAKNLDEHFKLNKPYYLHSAFINHSCKILPGLWIEAGLHYDFYTNFGSHVSPRASLSWEIFPKNRLKLMYGEAFRAPNFWELNNQGSLFWVWGNENLNPEILRNYELMYHGFLNSAFNFQTSLVYYELTHSIQTKPDTISGQTRWENSGGMHCQGIESELSYKRLSFIAYCNASFYQPKLNSSKNRIPFSPEWMLKAGFSKQTKAAKIAFELQTVGQRLKPGANRDVLSPFVLANLHVSNIQINKIISFSFGIYNLFDSQYEHPSFVSDLTTSYRNAIYPVTDIPADGRSLLFKMNLKFEKEK